MTTTYRPLRRPAGSPAGEAAPAPIEEAWAAAAAVGSLATIGKKFIFNAVACCYCFNKLA